EGCERLSQVRLRARGFAPVELHGAPAVVNGRVYFTTTTQLICIGKKGHKAPPDKIPEPVKEAPTAAGEKPAFLQVVPADWALGPGETVNSTAFAYDRHGRRLGKAEVKWERAPMLGLVYPIGLTPPKPVGKVTPPPVLAGELSGSGSTAKLTVAKAPNGQFGRVVAKMGGLTAHARIRVVPTLPYTMDFENVPEGRTPA